MYWSHMPINTFMSWIILKIWMNWKASKRVFFRRKNINPNYYVYCCVINCHGNSLLHLVCTKKSVVSDFKVGGWGLKYFETSISLNDYAEFNSKISYIMFLHDYLLVFEISTVRTLCLSWRLIAQQIGGSEARVKNLM